LRAAAASMPLASGGPPFGDHGSPPWRYIDTRYSNQFTRRGLPGSVSGIPGSVLEFDPQTWSSASHRTALGRLELHFMLQVMDKEPAPAIWTGASC